MYNHNPSHRYQVQILFAVISSKVEGSRSLTLW